MENATGRGTYQTGPQGSATKVATAAGGSTLTASAKSGRAKALPRLKFKGPKTK